MSTAKLRVRVRQERDGTHRLMSWENLPEGHVIQRTWGFIMGKGLKLPLHSEVFELD